MRKPRAGQRSRPVHADLNHRGRGRQPRTVLVGAVAPGAQSASKKLDPPCSLSVHNSSFESVKNGLYELFCKSADVDDDEREGEPPSPGLNSVDDRRGGCRRR